MNENGSFEIQDDKLIDKDVSKTEFIEWLEKRLKTVEILDVYFDECTSCEIGKPVVIINGGYFPRFSTDDRSEYDKFGLVLIIEGDKIVKTQFCCMFSKTANCRRFAITLNKLSALEKSGMSYKEAYTEVYGEEAYNEIGSAFDTPDYRKIKTLHTKLVLSYEEHDLDTSLTLCNEIIHIREHTDFEEGMIIVKEEIAYAREIKEIIEELSI